MSWETTFHFLMDFSDYNLELGRVKQRSAFEHAQNIKFHIIMHMRKVSSGYFSPFKYSLVSNGSVCG